MTYGELRDYGCKYLVDADIQDADIDAWYLLEYVTEMSRTDFFMRRDEVISHEVCQRYEEVLKLRSKHIPLQHITGHQEFMGLDFNVNGDVLVPRQDTELLVELALPLINDKKVLDMCTGSGCIVVSLSRLGKPALCMAADISEKALNMAKKNAYLNHADVTFVQSDMFKGVTGKFDVIVSNPPYIPQEVIETLADEVKDHDPYIALYGGDDGLEFYRRIALESAEHLEKGGLVMMEIGFDQAEDVMAIFREQGYTDIKKYKDLAGMDRVVTACLGMEDKDV